MENKIKKNYRRWLIIMVMTYFTLFHHILHAQTYTETFQDESAGSTVFTNNGNTFNLTSNLKIYQWSGWGYSGDDMYIGNDDDILSTAGVIGSITNSSKDFRVHSIWIWPSDASVTYPDNTGNVIFRGKLNGDVQFTLTVYAASINLNESVNNGYTYVDFNSYSSYAIDELEAEVTDGLRYLTIDEFSYSIASVSFSDGSSFTPNITSGSTNQVLGRMELTSNSSNTSITAATIKLNGTRTGLSNLKFWSSVDGTFGGDTQLGSTVVPDPGDGGNVNFSGFSSSISTSGTWARCSAMCPERSVRQSGIGTA